jgi:ribosomal protein L21
MTASGMPVFLQKKNAVLLNLAACSVGRIHFKEHPYLGRATNSPLFYEITEKLLRALTEPAALASGAGITLFEDESGRDMLLAVDYSRHDPRKIHTAREYTVMLKEDEGNITVGVPVIAGASVSAKVIKHIKGEKVLVFHKKRRKGYQKMNGHRQYLTQILITDIK